MACNVSLCFVQAAAAADHILPCAGAVATGVSRCFHGLSVMWANGGLEMRLHTDALEGPLLAFSAGVG